MSSCYSLTQTVRDAQYKKAWEEAPPEFLEEAEKVGLKPHIETPSGALEFNDNHERTAIEMPPDIDDYIDCLVEKHGLEHEDVIRGVAIDLKKVMDLEIERNRALSLGRILFYLVRSETRNIKASLFSAMHAIPRLAAANGMSSMRESAKACGVSPEWIRKSRDEICDLLQIPIPTESRKGIDARRKYASNGRTNHWRRQTTKKGIKVCKNQKQKPRIAKASTLLQEIARLSALRSQESKSETT